MATSSKNVLEIASELHLHNHNRCAQVLCTFYMSITDCWKGVVAWFMITRGSPTLEVLTPAVHLFCKQWLINPVY